MQVPHGGDEVLLSDPEFGFAAEDPWRSRNVEEEEEEEQVGIKALWSNGAQYPMLGLRMMGSDVGCSDAES